MARVSRQRLAVTIGASALVLMVGGCLVALGTGLTTRIAQGSWLVSQGAAVVALLAGLAARGRRTTLALVVPSLIYLLLLLGPV